MQGGEGWKSHEDRLRLRLCLSDKPVGWSLPTYSQMPPHPLWHWHQASRSIRTTLSLNSICIIAPASLCLLQRGGCNQSEAHLPAGGIKMENMLSIPSHPKTTFWGMFIKSSCPFPQEAPASCDIRHHSDADRNRRSQELLRAFYISVSNQCCLYPQSLSFVTMNEPLFKLATPHASGYPAPLTQEGLLPYSTLLSCTIKLSSFSWSNLNYL